MPETIKLNPTAVVHVQLPNGRSLELIPFHLRGDDWTLDISPVVGDKLNLIAWGDKAERLYDFRAEGAKPITFITIEVPEMRLAFTRPTR
jgi:hypothetical protein